MGMSKKYIHSTHNNACFQPQFTVFELHEHKGFQIRRLNCLAL